MVSVAGDSPGLQDKDHGAPGLSFQDRGVGRLQNSRHLEAVFWIRVILVLAGIQESSFEVPVHARTENVVSTVSDWVDSTQSRMWFRQSRTGWNPPSPRLPKPHFSPSVGLKLQYVIAE